MDTFAHTQVLSACTYWYSYKQQFPNMHAQKSLFTENKELNQTVIHYFNKYLKKLLFSIHAALLKCWTSSGLLFVWEIQ